MHHLWDVRAHLSSKSHCVEPTCYVEDDVIEVRWYISSNVFMKCKESIPMLTEKKIFILAEDLYQELEVWYPLLRFREEGAQVLVIGSGSAKEHKSKLGYPVKVDAFAQDVSGKDCDALIIPGGYAPDLMRR